MAQEFQGCLFDIISETAVEMSPVIRATYAEALADARKLVHVVNDEAEAFDETLDDQTVGRVDDSYCYVLVDGVIDYGTPLAA